MKLDEVDLRVMDNKLLLSQSYQAQREATTAPSMSTDIRPPAVVATCCSVSLIAMQK